MDKENGLPKFLSEENVISILECVKSYKYLEKESGGAYESFDSAIHEVKTAHPESFEILALTGIDGFLESEGIDASGLSLEDFRKILLKSLIRKHDGRAEAFIK